MELLVGLGIVLEDLCWLKLLSKLVAVAGHLVYKCRDAHAVQHAKGTAPKRWEADAKHGADVCGSGGAWDGDEDVDGVERWFGMKVSVEVPISAGNEGRRAGRGGRGEERGTACCEVTP